MLSPTLPHAELIVDRIAGGRFDLLIRYAMLRSVDDVAAKAVELDDALRRRLKSAGVKNDDACFQSLVAAGARGVTINGLVEAGLPEATLTDLLNANVIALHPGERCTFHTRYVERYFLMALAQGKG